jgi:hypothetical protein
LAKNAKVGKKFATSNRLEFFWRGLSAKWRYSAKLNIFPLLLVWESKQAEFWLGYSGVKLQDERPKSLICSIIMDLY